MKGRDVIKLFVCVGVWLTIAVACLGAFQDSVAGLLTLIQCSFVFILWWIFEDLHYKLEKEYKKKEANYRERIRSLQEEIEHQERNLDVALRLYGYPKVHWVHEPRITKENMARLKAQNEKKEDE